jgi:NitT/TauT family transport system substrate-binding protein
MKSLTLKNLYSLVFVIVLFVFMTPGCNRHGNRDKSADAVDTLLSGTDTKRVLREATFLPYWVTTAQFAGYYVAKEKGIYKKYGIDMKIIPYKPFVTSSDLISKGKVDFTALWLSNAIEMKAEGADIVNIAQVSSRSSAMLLTKKSSGINSIESMNGKRAGIWSGYELQPKALFKKYKVNVNIIPIGSSNNLFLMGGVDIINANWFDEYHSIINSGYDPEELNIFFYADYGFNFLEDGIYCLTDKLKKDPQLCADFLKATLDGWRYAFAHPDEAVDIVLKYAKEENMAMNKVHQRWMLDRYRDLYLPEGKTEFNNSLSMEDYLFVANVLKDDKLIDKIPEYSQFYQPIIKNR